jgi:Ala-tRNA(Pro) deacylase
MPVNAKLLAYLTAAGARYQVFPHQVEYTSQEIAEASHVPGRGLIKLVVLRDAQGSYLVAALPACMNVNLEKLERLVGRGTLTLASEHELRLLFPDCQIGSGPPFGHLYGLTMVMDPCLFESDQVYFQAGSHREVVGMGIGEFRRLARPQCATACFHLVATARERPERPAARHAPGARPTPPAQPANR